MSDWRNLQLSQLSLGELRDLAVRIEQELHERREQGRRWLREHGVREERGPTYRNPQNTRETWNGRGRRPAWMERALAQGYTLESLGGDGPLDPDLPVKSRTSLR